MKRKKRERAQRAAKAEFTNRPFHSLKKLPVGAAVAPEPGKVAAPPAVAADTPVDDEQAFLQAIAGTRPLTMDTRARVDSPRPTSEPRAISDEDAEALAELSDLVTGESAFDISDSDEYVEGAMVGIDPRMLRRLRRGEFAYQAHLDLHGMVRDEARQAVDFFIARAHLEGLNCVLIIHGRGLNSKDHIPVLKSYLTSWLARGRLGQRVLAFASARPCDGGAGALYVLLRKRRRKSRFEVRDGAKL